MTRSRIVRSGAILLIGMGCFAYATPTHAAETMPVFTVKNITMVPKPPTCEARATKKVIRSGGSFDLVWKSKGAVKMVGLTDGKEYPADGKQRISIAVRGKHEFPLTFISRHGGVATCTAKVFVHAKRS